MARDDEDDELDAVEPDADEDTSPIEEDDGPATPAPVEKELKDAADEDASKEIDDSEATAEDEVKKKPIKQEIDEEADDLMGQLPAKKEASPAPEVDEDGLVPSKPKSSLDRYQEFINEYKRLQANRQKSDLVAGLAAAGGKIGQSMAGKYSGNFTPDPAGPNLIRQMGERPVQDFEQNQVVQGRQMALKGSMDAADPASPQSKMVRDYVNQRLGMNLPDTVSAADAQMLLKTVGRPTIAKYQKVNGSYTDDEGVMHRVSASFDPQTHSYIDVNGKKLPDNFIAEGLNPFQNNIDPNTGEQRLLNKSRGTISPVGPSKAPALAGAQTPNEVYATISPEVRKELNNKIAPEFNKATEKTRQRLTHVPVIMQRLQEAQTNPAALPQLKAELARFDVGDQRLAQQEFNMFGQRMGYQGVKDWLEAHSTGTISKDFADSMAQAIGHVSEDLKGEMNDQAEERAKQLVARLPDEAKDVDPAKIAPLIYGGYKPKEEKVKVRNVQTGQEGYIPKKNLKKAIASKKYEQVP